MPGANGSGGGGGGSAFQPVRSSSPQYIGEYLHPRTLTCYDAAVVVTDSVASAPLEFRITQSVSAQFVDGKPSGQRRLGFARSFGHAHRRAHRGQGGRRRLPQTVALCRRQSKPDAQFGSSQVGQRFRPAQQQRTQPPAQQFGSADSV